MFCNDENNDRCGVYYTKCVHMPQQNADMHSLHSLEARKEGRKEGRKQARKHPHPMSKHDLTSETCVM